MMNNFLLESTITLGGLYTLYHVFLKNYKLLNFNRFYLIIIVVLAFILPFVNIELTQTSLMSFTPSSISLPALQNYQDFTMNQGASIQWLSLIYWVGFSVSCLRLIVHLLSIYQKFRSESQSYLGFNVLKSTNNSVSSFFNLLFVPAGFNVHSNENRMILEHENFHKRELHSLDNLIVHVIQCFLWFNPFIYLITKELKMQHEYIVDYLVASQESNSNYQNELILSALGKTNIVLSNAYKTHPIEKRINMLNRQTHTKMNKVRTYLTITFTCLTVILASFNYSHSAIIQNDQSQEVANDKILKGKVTNTNNEPLSMVIIKIKGTKRGVATNNKGEYKIALTDEDKKIVVSKEGYKKQEITLKKFSVLNIELSKK